MAAASIDWCSSRCPKHWIYRHRRRTNAALILYTICNCYRFASSRNLHRFIIIECELSSDHPLVTQLVLQARDPRNVRKVGGTARVVSRRDDVEPRRVTRFTPALRLCISGCVCSTKRPSSPSSSHLSATSDPTNDRSARNAPAHPSGRSSALLLRPFGSRIGCFSIRPFYFFSLHPAASLPDQKKTTSFDNGHFIILEESLFWLF